MAVVEEFCLAAKDKWPDCLIQFEDFQTEKAFAILERFREKFLCFNGAHSSLCPCLLCLNSMIALSPLERHAGMVLAVSVPVNNHLVAEPGVSQISTTYKVVLRHADDIQGTGAVVTAG